jgi:hypothetical protein
LPASRKIRIAVAVKSLVMVVDDPDGQPRRLAVVDLGLDPSGEQLDGGLDVRVFGERRRHSKDHTIGVLLPPESADPSRVPQKRAGSNRGPRDADTESARDLTKMRRTQTASLLAHHLQRGSPATSL